MKKRTAIIMAIVALAAITIFTIFSHQRRSNGPFLELEIRNSFLSGRPEFAFIIENDRTFTSYYRLMPSGVYEDKEEIILTEQEFQHISDLLDAVVSDYFANSYSFPIFGSSVTGMWFILNHNGYEYVNSSMVPRSLLYLEEEIRGLSPMRFPR